MVLDYDKDAYKPSVISAHGLKREAKIEKVARNYSGPDVQLVTDSFVNTMIDSGEILEILSSEGAGLLHNLEIVVDNPYTAVYLELDGYRNSDDSLGETPAELLLKNRTARVDGQFWVKTIGDDGSYTMMYTPMTPEPYRKKITVQLSNRIMTSTDVYGFSLNYTSRGGLPTPMKTDFMAGGLFTHSGLKEATLSTMEAAMAKPIGSSPYSVDDTYNQAVFNTNTDTIGSGHPYQGTAGRPILTKNADFDGTQGTIEFYAVGAAGADANAVAGPSLVSSGNFPGIPGTPSYQNMVIYKDTSKDVTETATLEFDEASGVLLNESNISADAQTTLTVDTVDATTKFSVGDKVLDNTGALIGVATAVTSTLITLSTNNVVAVANNENLRRLTDTIPKVGDRLFVRNKGSVYFPGIIQSVHRYNSGWKDAASTSNAIAVAYGAGTGAHCFQVSPGLRSVPSVFSKTSDSSDETISIGVVTSQADTNPKIHVKNVMIKRQIVNEPPR